MAQDPRQAEKHRQVILRALRALHPPLMEHWGDPEHFFEAARPIVQREVASIIESPEEVRALIQDAYRQTIVIRSAQFRSLATFTALDSVHHALESAISHSTPVAQGSEWLAYRIQQGAIAYLTSQEGQNHLKKAQQAFRHNEAVIHGVVQKGQYLELNAVEEEIIRQLDEHLELNLTPFQRGMMAAHIVESVRAASRKLPDLHDFESGITGEDSEDVFVRLFRKRVYDAELDEARARYARLNKEEQTKRFNDVKRRLTKVPAEAVAYGAKGLDALGFAVEVSLFPYPAKLEWVRPFLRPLYNTASSSNLFEGTNNIRTVQNRYTAIKKSGKVNAFLLELARVLTLTQYAQKEQEQREAFLKQVNLVEEFDFPDSLETMKKKVEARAGAAGR